VFWTWRQLLKQKKKRNKVKIIHVPVIPKRTIATGDIQTPENVTSEFGRSTIKYRREANG
jgi:hypothetical protein